MHGQMAEGTPQAVDALGAVDAPPDGDRWRSLRRLRAQARRAERQAASASGRFDVDGRPIVRQAWAEADTDNFLDVAATQRRAQPSIFEQRPFLRRYLRDETLRRLWLRHRQDQHTQDNQARAEDDDSFALARGGNDFDGDHVPGRNETFRAHREPPEQGRFNEIDPFRDDGFDGANILPRRDRRFGRGGA